MKQNSLRLTAPPLEEMGLEPKLSKICSVLSSENPPFWGSPQDAAVGTMVQFAGTMGPRRRQDRVDTVAGGMLAAVCDRTEHSQCNCFGAELHQ
jgi:hypothetical protein